MIFCQSNAVLAQDIFKSNNLSGVNVDNLSNSDIQKIKAQLKSNEMSIDQAEPIVLSKGMSAAEFTKLKERLAEATIDILVCDYAPEVVFQSDNLVLTENQPFAKLSWWVKYASEYKISNNISTEGDSGSIVVSPSNDTTYTLTATNDINGCSSTDQVIVTVNNTQPTANAGTPFTKTSNSKLGADDIAPALTI